MQYQFVVIGGGIVGLSAAMHLLARYPGRSLLLLEKETAVGTHQTGHNSGVVHAGVYYPPGSLRARFCREGAAATSAFCRQHRLPFERCGKLLVATGAAELQRMEALAARCASNDVAVQVLDAAELRRREPHIVGVGALFVPATAIVDYRAIARVMAARIQAQGGDIRLGQCVQAIDEGATQVSVATGTDRFQARQVIVCAGLMADRLADWCGLASDFRVVPFRGEYYRLPQRMAGIIQHLIYPIPDPGLPFLGVHLTRTIGSGVIAGPNAVLSLSRAGYSRAAFNLRDTLEMLRFQGFVRLARRHLRVALAEQWSSWCKSAYARRCRRYCPEIRASDLAPCPSGVRAQVVLRDGTLLHDFLLRRTARTLHVCNAPSPAATAALPIGRHIAAEVCAD